MQENHSDCSGVAQHALVLGLSDHVQPNPTEPAQFAERAYTALQSDPSQKSDKPKSPASAIKEQCFSGAVAERIEAPQRRSTRSVYEAKWSIFTKWCISNQVDFRAPPIKSVADFLMYLFWDRKVQPSTIDDYRSAIADKLGNSDVLPSGSLFLLFMRLNSSLSSLTSEQVCKKRGGCNVGIAPGNRLLITDQGLKGFPTSRSTQAVRNFVSFVYEFT